MIQSDAECTYTVNLWHPRQVKLLALHSSGRADQILPAIRQVPRTFVDSVNAAAGGANRSMFPLKMDDPAELVINAWPNISPVTKG